MKNTTDLDIGLFQLRLRQLREGHVPPLTQEKMGATVGVSRGSISFYENGDRLPDVETLKRIAEAFEVSSDWLIGLSDFKSREIEHIPAEALGLSENAINALLIANEHPECGGDPEIVRAINILLEGLEVCDTATVDNRGWALLHIAEFFDVDFEVFGKTLEKGGLGKEIIARLSPDAFERTLLSDIANSLRYLRDKYTKEA